MPLSLGSTATCDVCLEPYGRGIKSPCSVRCGHVFCIECVNHLRASTMNPAHPDIEYGAPCPLCRNHFDGKCVTKLHVDFDGAKGNAPPQATCLTAAETEAKRIQEAIADVANAGTTEPRLRQLISDATTFLSVQPRDQFTDLRISHRMIAYLCETKSKLRDQKVDYERQISKLKEEKGEMERKAEVVASARRDERESALAIEMSLREHCARAHKAYEDMVGHYNFVVAEWSKLGEQLSRLRSTETHIFDRNGRNQSSDPSTPEFASNLDSSLSSYHDQRMRPSGAAITDSASLLVSPLPQFTGAFPTISMNAFPLPEIESDREMRLEIRHEPPPHSAAHCNARGHPVACPCVEVPLFPELPRSVQQTERSTGSRSHSATTLERPAAVLNRPAPIPIPEREPEAILNGDNSYHTAQRSSSRNRRSRSRASGEATQPPSPVHIPVQHTINSSSTTSNGSSVRTHGRTSAATDDSIASSSSSGLPATPLPHGYKNNVLQDLLQDTPVGTPSSLPNMPIHPPSFTRRESHNSREKDRSSPPYSSLHPPMLQAQDREHQPASSSEPVPTRPSLPASYSSNTVSSASSAAKAMEKARIEREQAERAEREREKEREEKERERERDRYRESRENLDQYTESSDRHRRKAAREGSSSTHSKHQRVEPVEHIDRDRSQIGSSSSSSRHSSSRDSPPILPSISSYVSHRTASSSQPSYRSGGASSLRSTFGGDPYASKAMPVMSATKA